MACTFVFNNDVKITSQLKLSTSFSTKENKLSNKTKNTIKSIEEFVKKLEKNSSNYSYLEFE